MSNGSTSAGPRHRTTGSVKHPSVSPYLTAGVADASAAVRTSVETSADNASTVEQHPPGQVDKKPKRAAAKGEQEPGHDQSATRSASQ